MHSRIKQYSCPCCGNHIGEAAPIESVIDAVTAINEKTVLIFLSKRLGEYVDRDSIVSHLWSGTKNGGVSDTTGSFHGYIFRLRKRLEPFGWTIATLHGGGPKFAGHGASYRLIPLEASA